MILVSGSCRMAEYGQTLTHMPQPVHRVSSTWAVMASTVTWPWDMRMLALEAAAEAWVTESLMSLGPSAQPAKKIPPVGVSTGRSLGWASRKKPSEPVERFRSRWTTGLSLRGSMPTERMAMSLS